MNDELNGFLAEGSQEPQVDELQAPEVSQEAPAHEPHGEPTSPSTEKHVPLAALEAERNQRKDWKEKAIRAEAERDALRTQYERAAQPVQQEERPADPIQVMQQRMVDQHYNTSFLLARQSYKDLDDKVTVFMEAAKANPALVAAMAQQAHPYEFAYREAERMMLQKEMGDDPTAYRAKIEAEIREKIMAEMGQSAQTNPAAGAARIPQSLAGARSSAGRSTPAFTGPQPLDDILNR
jgi:hypothetical protein